MQRKKERRAAGSVQAGDSNQTGRLGKIQGWLEPLLLSCTRQQGLAQGCRSPSTPARASEQCLVRTRAWKGLKMSKRCREHKRVDGGTWTVRGTWPSAAEKCPVPRSPPQSSPPARPLELLAANPCRDGCKPMQRCLLLPARLACSATCRQRQCSSDARRGRQQATAMNFLLLHQPSPAFNSSQTLDPKSSAISQAAGIPRLTGRAADANKGLFFSFPFMQLLAGARLFPRRPHPESSCSLLLYAER